MRKKLTKEFEYSRQVQFEISNQKLGRKDTFYIRLNFRRHLKFFGKIFLHSRTSRNTGFFFCNVEINLKFQIFAVIDRTSENSPIRRLRSSFPGAITSNIPTRN